MTVLMYHHKETAQLDQRHGSHITDSLASLATEDLAKCKTLM